MEESKKHHAYDSKMTWEENIKRPFFSYYPSTIMRKMLPSKYQKVNEIQSKIEELEKQERLL